jgi:hypothetical protein
MLDKREAAKFILEEIDQKAPIVINWNFRQQWLDAIVSGLKRVESIEKSGR